MKKSSALTAIIVICIILCNCNMHYRTYQGQKRPLKEISVLYCSDGISVYTIDGKEWNELWKTQPLWDDVIEFMPGKHYIGVSYYKSDYGPAWSTKITYPIRNINFNAEPGHLYAVLPSSTVDTNDWSPFVKDVTNESKFKNSTRFLYQDEQEAPTHFCTLKKGKKITGFLQSVSMRYVYLSKAKKLYKIRKESIIKFEDNNGNDLTSILHDEKNWDNIDYRAYTNVIEIK